MSGYFEYFPTVDYCGNKAVNLMCRARIRAAVLQDASVYYPYVVKDGDRPDIIATKYYGTPLYTWLIFYANDIIDPLFDWPLEQASFNRYLVERYRGADLELSDAEVLRKCNTTVWHYIDVDGRVIDEKTYRLPGSTGARALSVYDYENWLNEQKRRIKVIDKMYASQIVDEMSSVFK